MLRPRPSLLRKLVRKFGHADAKQQLRWINEELVSRRREERPSTTNILYRLLRDEPLGYLLGTQPFGSLSIKVSPPVLIPRPETEEWTCEMLRRITAYGPSTRRNWKVLDICTGTGCIPALLCKEWSTNLFGPISAHAVDISEHSVSLASLNAANALLGTEGDGQETERRLDTWKMDIFGEEFIKWLEFRGPFDIVTFNPPYIPRRDWQTLPASVKDYEDPGALIGGEDGLEFYRRIAWILRQTPLLRSDAWLAIEFGHGQGQDVKKIMGETDKLGHVEIWTDAFGVERALFCRGKS